MDTMEIFSSTMRVSIIMKIILYILTAIIFTFSIGRVFAQSQGGENIIINNIVMNNFFPSDFQALSTLDEINVIDTSGYSTTYVPNDTYFRISILQAPFDDTRWLAENDFVESLGITKSEACFLDVEIDTPRYVDEDKAFEEFNLSFCDEPKLRYDFNNDRQINGVDLAVCIQELQDQFNGVNEKQNCDFDVSRDIDAADLSGFVESLGNEL